MAAYQEKLPELEAQGFQLVGLSADAREMTEAFRKELGLTFMILCDPERQVIREWDRYQPFEMGGIAKSSLFIIDSERRVEFRALDSVMHRYPVDEVLLFLKSRDRTSRSGEPRKRFVVPRFVNLLFVPWRMVSNIFRKKVARLARAAAGRSDDDGRYDLIPLVEQEELAKVLDAPLAVIYKHSPVCGLSSDAIREMKLFKRDRPNIPTYMVDVLASSQIAYEIEARTGIRHESPQAILIVDGKVRWHDSHRGVNGEALAAQLEDLTPQS